MRRRGSLVDLTVLVAFAALVGWHVCRGAVVPALDSVRYVALAQQIGCDGLLAVARENADQPLFPALVAGAHALLPERLQDSPRAWLVCAQAVAAVAMALAAVPVYWLIAVWMGRQKALLSGLLFILLPEIARLGGDGLSDSTALLAIGVALACLAQPFCRLRAELCGMASQSASVSGNRTSMLWLFIAGAATGVALFVRAEALLLAPALLATLVWCRPLASRLVGRLLLFAVYGTGTAVVLLPYLFSVGATTQQAIAARLLGNHESKSVSVLNAVAVSRARNADSTRWQSPAGDPLVFTRKDPSASSRRPGLFAAAGEYARELAKLTHYWIGVFAVWGAWKMRGARNCWPGRLLLMFFGVYSACVVLYGARVGYLSTRHLLPLAPVLVGWASHGVFIASEKLLRAGKALFHPAAPTRATVTARWLVVVGILPLLPVTLLPLHANRSGYRLAGEWLAAHGGRDASVLDTQGWTALFSGHPTYRAEAGDLAVSSPALRYVVVEQSELRTDSDRAKTLRSILNASGSLRGSFVAPGNDPAESVLLYEWSPARFTAQFARSPVQRRQRKS